MADTAICYLLSTIYYLLLLGFSDDQALGHQWTGGVAELQQLQAGWPRRHAPARVGSGMCGCQNHQKRAP